MRRKRKKTKRTRKLKGGVRGDLLKLKERTKEQVAALEENFNKKHGDGAYAKLRENPLDFWKKKTEEKMKEGARKAMEDVRKAREKDELEALEKSILDAYMEAQLRLKENKENRPFKSLKSIFGRKSKKRRKRRKRRKTRKKKSKKR